MERDIEQGFFELLQSDVLMTIDGKKYKAGRFLNFKMKEFYVQLDLVVNDKYRKVDIPLPFAIKSVDRGIIFSYKLEDMGSYGSEILKMFQNTIGGGKSKLYNKELLIKRVMPDE
jgi:hypothetical protein